MNKIAPSVIAAYVVFATAAHAQDVVVIKDTRRYTPYNNSVSGPVGCTMPKDLDHPNLDDQNECRVTRGKLVTSGELVTRSKSRGVCVRTVFSGATRRMGGEPAAEVIPDQSLSEEAFKCDSDGARVS